MNSLAVGTVVGGYRIVRIVASTLAGFTYHVVDEKGAASFSLFEYAHSDYSRRAPDGIAVEPRSKDAADEFEWLVRRFIDVTGNRLIEKGLYHPLVDAPRQLIHANGTAYLLSDFDGDSVALAALVKDQGPLGEEEFDDLIYPLLDALAYLHGQEVLHSGIAPEAIRIARDGTPRLGRLGFWWVEERAWDTSALPSHSGQPPEYFPQGDDPTAMPELSPASDVYALSALGLWALTGKKAPFALRLLSLAMQERSGAVADDVDPVGDALAPLVGRVRPELIATLRAGLAVDQKDRPQSAGAFRALLDGQESRTRTSRRA